MLISIIPARGISPRAEFMPEMLRPLVSAVENGLDITKVVVDIVRRLGSDNMMYGASTSARLDHESKSYVFTTFPQRWVAQYDQQAYIEVDTRITRALDSALPVVWDYVTERTGLTGSTAMFFDDMLANGVGSGVIYGIHGPHNTRVIVSLSYTNSQIDDARRNAIARNLAEIMLFGTFFHEIFMKSVIEQGIPPSFQGAPLSARERDCLVLAAHGQTTQDMACALGKSERTIQFHFDGIRSKLGAANRQEAVAKAMAMGIIQP
jgi:DNA-binding CsgD family transcriptional regulator